MKKIILSTMLFFSTICSSELPSWGMTENQYKLPNFSNKMGEIGKQAYDKNWLLKVTAPNDWHNTIRNALTKTGEREVQLIFKDSVFQSIAISATPGAKIAKISSSSNNQNAIVNKQVEIDKPEMESSIEAPDFGTENFKSAAEMDLAIIDLGVPTIQTGKPTKNRNKTSEPTAKVNAKPPVTAKVPVTEVKAESVKSAPAANKAVESSTMKSTNSDVDIENKKEVLRKRHARSKRVEKQLSYASITNKDELYINGSVVLIKRFVNRGIVVYFWMREAYDPTIHKLVEKGSEKFVKDTSAEVGVSPENINDDSNKSNEPTNLDFIAVDTVVEDKNDLRKDFIRSKRVDKTITVNRLKKGDLLYVLNQTVLVERPINRSQSVYFWLVGSTEITQNVKRQGTGTFLID